MNYLSRYGLADILRRCQDNVGVHPSHFLIVGSKSLLGTYDLGFESATAPLLASAEIDILLLGDDTDLWYPPDSLNVHDGPDSDSVDITIDAVSLTTSTVPTSWTERLVPFEHESANGAVGWCLAPGDLFVAKAVANREKTSPICELLPIGR